MMKSTRRRGSLPGHDYPNNNTSQNNHHNYGNNSPQPNSPQLGADDNAVSFWSSYSVVESLFADDPTSVVIPVSGNLPSHSNNNGNGNGNNGNNYPPLSPLARASAPQPIGSNANNKSNKVVSTSPTSSSSGISLSGSPRRQTSSFRNSGGYSISNLDVAEQQMALGGVAGNYHQAYGQGSNSSLNSFGGRSSNSNASYGSSPIGFSTSPTSSSGSFGKSPSSSNAFNSGWGEIGSGSITTRHQQNPPRSSYGSTSSNPRENYAAYFASGHGGSLSTSALPIPMSSSSHGGRRDISSTNNGWGDAPVIQSSSNGAKNRTFSSPPSPLLFQRDALTDPFVDPAAVNAPNSPSTSSMYSAFSSGFVSPIGSPRNSGSNGNGYSNNSNGNSNKGPRSPSGGRRSSLPHFATSPSQLQQHSLMQQQYNNAHSSHSSDMHHHIVQSNNGGQQFGDRDRIPANASGIASLPSWFLLRMMAFLSARDLAVLQMLSPSSKRLADLAADDRLWKDLYLKRWRLLETSDATSGKSSGRAPATRDKHSASNSSVSGSSSHVGEGDDGEDDSGDEWAWIFSLLQQNNRWKDIYRTRYSADRWRVGTLKMFNGCWGFISQTPDPYSFTPASASSAAQQQSNSIVRSNSSGSNQSALAQQQQMQEEAPLDIFFHRKDIAADGDWYEDWWLKDTPGVSRSQKCGYWDTFLCGRAVRYRQRAAYAQGRRPQACCISFVGDERRERLGTTPSAAVAAAVAAAASGVTPIIPGMPMLHGDDEHSNISPSNSGGSHATRSDRPRRGTGGNAQNNSRDSNGSNSRDRDRDRDRDNGNGFNIASPRSHGSRYVH